MTDAAKVTLVKTALGLLVFAAGWMGAEVISPGLRITKLEAEQTRAQVSTTAELHRQDSVHLEEIRKIGGALAEHLAWANVQRDRLQTGIDALSRLKCIEAQAAGKGLDLLAAAGIACQALLGNRTPSQ